MSAEDFKVHVDKKSHRDEMAKVKLTQVNPNGNGIQVIQTASNSNNITNVTNATNGCNNSNLNIESLSSIKSSDKFNGSNLSLNSASSTNASTSNGTSVFSMQNMKTAIGSNGNVLKESSPTPSTSKSIGNLIKIEDISKIAKINMMQLLSRSAERVKNEKTIIDTLSIYFKTLDSTINVVPFGSSTYGFGSKQTDFNVLIKTGENLLADLKNVTFLSIKRCNDYFEGASKSKVLFETCENAVKMSGTSSVLQQQFEFMVRTSANRVQKQQLKIVHKQSRIVCTLLFDSSSVLEMASEKIRQFTSLNPMCMYSN